MPIDKATLKLGDRIRATISIGGSSCSPTGTVIRVKPDYSGSENYLVRFDYKLCVDGASTFPLVDNAEYAKQAGFDPNEYQYWWVGRSNTVVDEILSSKPVEKEPSQETPLTHDFVMSLKPGERCKAKTSKGVWHTGLFLCLTTLDNPLFYFDDDLGNETTLDNWSDTSQKRAKPVLADLGIKTDKVSNSTFDAIERIDIDPTTLKVGDVVEIEWASSVSETTVVETTGTGSFTHVFHSATKSWNPFVSQSHSNSKLNAERLGLTSTTTHPYVGWNANSKSPAVPTVKRIVRRAKPEPEIKVSDLKDRDIVIGSIVRSDKTHENVKGIACTVGSSRVLAVNKADYPGLATYGVDPGSPAGIGMLKAGIDPTLHINIIVDASNLTNFKKVGEHSFIDAGTLKIGDKATIIDGESLVDVVVVGKTADKVFMSSKTSPGYTAVGLTPSDGEQKKAREIQAAIAPEQFCSEALMSQLKVARVSGSALDGLQPFDRKVIQPGDTVSVFENGVVYDGIFCGTFGRSTDHLVLGPNNAGYAQAGSFGPGCWLYEQVEKVSISTTQYTHNHPIGAAAKVISHTPAAKQAPTAEAAKLAPGSRIVADFSYYSIACKGHEMVALGCGDWYACSKTKYPELALASGNDPNPASSVARAMNAAGLIMSEWAAFRPNDGTVVIVKQEPELKEPPKAEAPKPVLLDLTKEDLQIGDCIICENGDEATVLHIGSHHIWTAELHLAVKSKSPRSVFNDDPYKSGGLMLGIDGSQHNGWNTERKDIKAVSIDRSKRLPVNDGFLLPDDAPIKNAVSGTCIEVKCGSHVHSATIISPDNFQLFHLDEPCSTCVASSNTWTSGDFLQKAKDEAAKFGLHLSEKNQAHNLSRCDSVKLTGKVRALVPAVETERQEPIAETEEPVKKDNTALGTLLLGGAAFIGAMLSQSAKAQIQGVRVASDIEPELFETEVEPEVLHVD